MNDNLRSITGFIKTMEVNEPIFPNSETTRKQTKTIIALHDIDIVIIRQDDTRDRIIKDDKAREIYNQFYKEFPK